MPILLTRAHRARQEKPHIPAQQQRAANHAPRSAAGVGGEERVATAPSMRD